MGNTTVFQDRVELERLAVQNRLLAECDGPVYQRLFAGRQGLRLLDVGCNNGGKTVDRFSCDPVAQVLGLEYSSALVEQAQAACVSGKFTFRQCDAETPDFPRRLRQLMDEQGIAAFDVVHLSFVLLHMKDPAALLTALRGVLAPGGQLMIVETNDRAGWVSPDGEGLFSAFLDCLEKDPFSGDRACGPRLPALLARLGYGRISHETAAIRASGGEEAKKRDLFTFFFSYLPEDVKLLHSQGRQEEAAPCALWLERNYDALRRLITAPDTELSIAVSIITCTKE